MIKGTRFFSRRLLPLLLAAVMLLGMLPALTLPVLALPVLAEDPPASQKLTNTTDTVVTYQGAVGTGRAPSLVVDGDTSHNDNKYFVVGNDQTQEKNETNPANPTYWIQLDLGKKYSLTEMKLFVYHGRALKNLVVLASDSSTFDTYRIIWNADKENFFGLGTGDKEQFPNATVAGDTITLAAPTEAQYVRILNNGHTAGAGQGAHYFEIEVYGTEHTGGAPETRLYNVAADCNVIVNKWGGGSDRPNSWLTDGIKDNAKYIEVCKDKAQDMNAPSYAQIDLGNIYPVSKVNFWNYWDDGRTLKDLHIILSTTEDFRDGTTKEVYNANWTAAQNGLEVQIDSGPFTARYVRIWNDGHDKGKGGHYIEVEVWSTEEKKDPLPVPYQFRDVLTIPTYEYQGKTPNNVTHPDVLDFTLVNGAGGTPLGTWGGHRFWMAVTPNQEGNSQFENPCLVWSDDGKIWSAEGIPNPLSVVEREPDGTHNCDNDVIYDPVSNELWVYYVWEQDAQNYGQIGTSNFKPSILRCIRVAATQGGSGFTYAVQKDAGQENPYTDLVTSTYHYDMQSPAVVRRDANTWLMWSNNSDQGVAPTGWNNQNGFVELRRSTNGTEWGEAKSLKPTLVLQNDWIPWHLDVQWIPNVGADGSGEYWALICAYPKGGGSNHTDLFFAKSADGELWTTYPNPILSPRSGQWDQNFIYRSSFTYDADGKLSVWYSGGKEQPGNHWRIAYTEFENFLTKTLPTLGAPYTPGTPTPPPVGEDGWVSVPASDDTNIHFDGAWTYEAPNRFAGAEGSTATLYFYGSGIRYYAQYETNFGEVEVQIDDGTPETYDLHRNAPGAMDNKILERELEADYHRITIKRKHGGGLDSGVIDLNKFEVRYDTSATISNHLYGVSPTEKTLWVDDTLQISALVPFNATDKTVTYTSSDTDKATVTATGLVTALAAGDVTITVKAGQSEKTVALTIRSLDAGALRMTVDKDNPLFLHGLYKYDGKGYPANGLAGPLQGGKSIQGFWTALTGSDATGWQGPTVQAGNKTVHHAILIHASGTVEGSEANKKWYLDRIAETKKDNIPFFLMVSNSHTGAFLDLDWLDGIYEQNENMMGVVFSENHNAGISERDRRITYMDALVKQAAKWGGYVINCDMNDAPKDTGGSDHGGTLEYFLNNETLYQTLKKYSQNYILLAKTTSAWSNVSYNSHESVALGAWLDGLCGNWGSLIDSWMWFIEGYGPQWGDSTFDVFGGAEECRGPVSMPELLFAMRMVQQARTGATVFTFEHPDHAEAVGDNEGAKTYFTPNYKYSIAKAMEYMRDYAIPTREQVMQNTKVFYASSGGTLNKLGSNAANRLLDPLYGDSGSSGPNKSKNNGTTMMTYSTGRYGTIPSLPKMAQDPTGKDILRMADVQALGGAAGIQNYFNARYPQRYNGTGYAHYDELTKSWLTYNSNWFFDTRENSALHSKQNVSFQLTQNSFGANIEFEPYSMLLVDEAQAGTLQFRFNNYWVDKNPIWEGYVKGTTPTWDSDNNRLMYNYLKDSYAQNTAHGESTWRKATITISGLGAEPTLALTSSLAGQSKQIQTAFDAAAGTYTITLDGNGYQEFSLTNLVPAQAPAENWVYVDSHSGQIQYTGNWVDETSTNHYEGSAKEANDAPGATASLTFTGTGFRWIGQMDSNYGRAWIYVDDVLVAIGNANSSTNPYQFTILELHGLENKQHTVRLAAESNAPVQVDAFAYYTGTDLDETVSSVALEPSGLIRLGDGESKPVLAMAMNAERVVVFRDDFRFTLENDTIAGLSGDGKPQKTVTGKMAGRTRLHVTLPELNDKSATAEIVVTSTEPATTPRMLVDAEHPLLLVSLYANTKHPAWWDNSGIPGVPMQGHNTMEGVWSLIPEDLKPYTAIQLHADDYLGHAWGGTGNKENLQKFYEYHVAIAQEKGINLYLTLMTGGVPINTFRNLIDMDWLNNLIDNNSCIKGVVFAENHHNGDTDAVAQLTAEYLELFSSKGIYLVLTDIDDANHRMEKWFENDTLFKTAQKHHKYLVINSKSTSSSGYNTVRSFALGTWLSGLADNWGALTDAWAWYEIRYHKLFEPVMNTTYEDVRRVYTFPETLFAMNMLQSYVNGGTVFNAEHPFYCTGVYDEASWVLKESIIPTMRYMIANPAATREQVKGEIKAVYHTDSYLPTNFAEGLYGTAQDNNLLQTSGRYRTLPVLSSKLSDAEASAFGRVLKSADLADKINILNAQYPELSTGDAFVETLLGGGAGQTGRRLLIMNSLFNENKNQSATLTPTDAAFATSMGYTLTPHTYLIAHETADSIKIDLNNFRTDKDELWVPGESENPDWTSFGNDWNGDHKDYVQDYMKYHISNPKLDKGRDLRSTVITLHTGNRPTAVVTRNGGSTKLADDNFYTETYENGVYTLTITHNGQVNVTIRKGGAEPTPTVTDFRLTTDPSPLTSAGGKAMLTLTGTNLPDGTKFYWGTNQAMLTSVDAEGSDAFRSAEVKLLENTGTDAVTYYFRYSLDGTTLAGELTATVPGTGGGTQPTEPSVTDYSVAPTELPSNGGMITVTLAGTNLQNGIQIKVGTITAKTSGDAAEQTATLTLPANYSSSSVSYTVQYSLNGTDWFGGKTVRVSGHYTPPVGPVTPSVPTKPGVPERDPFPFTDVSRSSWYYDSVRAAWEKDLIDGVTRTLYKPDDTLTVAQAIKLSAALHQMLNNNGKVTLRNGSPYWYSSYVSYAVDNGIIEKMYLDYTPAQMNTPVKRNEFVHIFYGAMSDYRQINTVADNKIPDVITTDTYALEIYTFYRAGILTGSDKNGTFYPTNDIKRSEVAAILSRMYDKTARKTVSLP